MTASAPRTNPISRLNSPARTYRCRRFACALTGTNARLAATVGRYSFDAGLSHSHLTAGLSRRTMTRGHRGSLLLRCRALSSPSPCRFIPALSPRPRQALRSARVAALCWHRAPPPLNSDRILRLSKTVLDKNSELYWSDHIFNDLLFEFYRSTTSGTNDF